MHLAVALVALAIALAVAVARPFRVPEAVVAVPLAAVVVAVGAVSGAHATAEVDRLGPVVGFLAAVLVLADACDGDGLFTAAGDLLAVAARTSAGRLLVAVVALAAVTTATLSLDTTIVLLTPVVVATVRATGVRARPPLYAVAHLANTGSLLLPVSNLTNLLALATVSVSFGRFAALMVLPWLVGIVVELVALRLLFASDVAVAADRVVTDRHPVPVVTAVVVVLTVAGFVVGSLAGVAPAWIALAGALVLVIRRFLLHRTSVVAVVRAASISFCLWALALGVIVRAVSDSGVGSLVTHLVPSGSSYLTLLAIAAVSAVLANVVNNLPAVLLVLPVAAAGGVAPVLATLIGVNLGPNLTYPGSLATLLWRRVVAGVDGLPSASDFSRIAVLTVPVGLVACTFALWLALRVLSP